IDTKYNIFIKDIYFTLFTFYWISAILSTFLGSEYAAFGKGLTSPWSMLIFFVPIYFIDKKYLPYIVFAFAVGLFIMTLSGYYYYIRFGDIDYRYFRSHSLAGGYMMTAHLLSIGIIFLASIILSKLERNKYIILFYIIVMLTSLHVLLITATRMPLLAVIIVISLMFIVKLKWKGVIAAFVILISAFIYIITDDYMLARFENFFASFNEPLSSNGWRLLLWKNGIEIFKEYPLFGIGVDAYKSFMVHVMPENNIYLPLSHAHNSFLMHLITFGIAGFITFCFFYGKMLFDLVKNIFKSPYAFCGSAVMFGYFIEALTEYNTGLSMSSMQVLFLTGIMIGIMKKDKIL
ncbi:MAG: O-antigen ligase family protein, partial [Mucispirillum sp.]|nr:O-antigen ligase family protein [Mucispirillum sp.]